MFAVLPYVLLPVRQFPGAAEGSLLLMLAGSGLGSGGTLAGVQRVLYVSGSDPNDVVGWSGSTYRIFQTLKGMFPAVESLVVEGMPTPFSEKVYGSIQHRLFGRHAYYELRHAVTRHYARQVEIALKGKTYDALFAPGTIYFTEVETEIPMYATADACFGGLLNYYPEFTNLTPRDVAQGLEIDRRGVAACRRVFYTSDWARQKAIETAGIDPDRVEKMIAVRPTDRVDMLLVGVDWERKGGQIAFEAVEEMNRRGTRTTLHVVGCAVPESVRESPFVEHHGFLRKSVPAELARLTDLFARSHVLILPTRAECYGLVFAEAGEYGLPVLATRTGGVPTAVRDGVNGYALDYDAAPEAFAERALDILSDAAGYRSLCLSAKDLVSRKLSWQVCAATWKREMDIG
jgi:glycosyltransferase involved in cell wall biosynthesis